MPRQMHASIAVDLSADQFEEAAEKMKIKPIWDAFLAGLNEAGIKLTSKLETIETRAKPMSNGTARAPRRTKAQMQAEAPQAAQNAMNATVSGERVGSN